MELVDLATAMTMSAKWDPFLWSLDRTLPGAVELAMYTHGAVAEKVDCYTCSRDGRLNRVNIHIAHQIVVEPWHRKPH